MRSRGASTTFRIARRLKAACSKHDLIRCYSSKGLDFQAIDTKWQRVWRDSGQWQKAERQDKGKYYVLPMFPYPSGALHLGHLRVYTISDVIARYRRMMGHHVLHPIGWDAFGLPAENAAIERGVDPREWTLGNIAKMKSQIIGMGGCWNWDKELLTCDPSFYADTQRLFLRLHQKGLAYQAEAIVNYDPVDKTVLANEQVDSNGFSWRSGARAEKISLRQWFFRITAFQDTLLDDLAQLEHSNAWPQHIVTMQKNWLGKSHGASVTFSLEHGIQNVSDKALSVFTTRPDTLYGVQYLALSIQHPIVKELAKTTSELQAFIDSPQAADQQSKAGFLLPDIKAYNPLLALDSGSNRVTEPLPVFAAPYVLPEYGSGAVMGVPAHDARDFSFWRTNQGDARVAHVVVPSPGKENASQKQTSQDPHETAFVQLGTLSEECGKHAGRPSTEAGRDIVDDLQRRNQSAEHVESWRLRDWLISRQRYWGTPIPIVHCKACGAVPVPEDQLPVTLPPLDQEHMAEKGGNPLEHATDWLSTPCPECHGPARRETDTMDTFVDSSWYYFKFALQDARATLDRGEASYMPVDVYIGGVEHAILHLLYARFISKFMADAGLWRPPSDGTTEPFQQLVAQGMVHGLTYSDPDTGRFLKPEEVDASSAHQPVIKATGKPPRASFEKMSKSKYNGVDPTDCIARYGADATRAHMLFQAPVGDILDWDEDKIVGVQRWFRRVHNVAETLHDSTAASTGVESKSVAELMASSDAAISDADAELWATVQTTVASVNKAYGETYSLNTAVSDLMQLTNALAEAVAAGVGQKTTVQHDVAMAACSTLLRLTSPIAPSIVEECWATLFGDTSTRAFEQPFPQPDGTLEQLRERSQTCAFQVNGRLKFVARIARPPDGLDDDEVKRWVLRRALESQEGADAVNKGRWKLSDAKKIVVVKRGRTVNVVI